MQPNNYPRECFLVYSRGGKGQLSSVGVTFDLDVFLIVLIDLIEGNRTGLLLWGVLPLVKETFRCLTFLRTIENIPTNILPLGFIVGLLLQFRRVVV